MVNKVNLKTLFYFSHRLFLNLYRYIAINVKIEKA